MRRSSEAARVRRFARDQRESLYARQVAGVLGGIRAVAALGLGTEAIAPVDIDFFVNPAETLIVVDEAFGPFTVAVGLLSQAEHGPDQGWRLGPLPNLRRLRDRAIRTDHGLPTPGAARYTGGLWLGKSLKTVTYQEARKFDSSAMLGKACGRLSRLECFEGRLARVRCPRRRTAGLRCVGRREPSGTGLRRRTGFSPAASRRTSRVETREKR
jgi:histidinol dehydrogenase